MEARGIKFVPETHRHAPPFNADTASAVAALRAALRDRASRADTADELGLRAAAGTADARAFLTDVTLHRMLRAREFDPAKALKLLAACLRWRHTARVWAAPLAALEPHQCTGKIRLTGRDRHGRPVLVFHNACENCKAVGENMRFLAWNLERAARRLRRDERPAAATDATAAGDEGDAPPPQKFVIFIHLEDFSLWNAPGAKATRETLRLVQDCFPERLGHCVLWQPAAYFRVFYKIFKRFIDAKTRSKLVLLHGDYDHATRDVAAGGGVDAAMRGLVGDDWRRLCGVGTVPPAWSAADSGRCWGNGGAVPKGWRTPPYFSPGYEHASYWAEAVEERARWDAAADAAAAAAAECGVAEEAAGGGDDDAKPVDAEGGVQR